MHPSKIDPLNGYALLAVALMGCIAPVFTLLLLHSHGVKSWFGTTLCAISWLLNTIVFFMLVRNLTGSLENTKDVDDVLRGLLQTDFCGGSSAMVLCQQWTGSNPLGYVSGFYNKQTIPNIHNIPVVWAYVTLVFLVLVASQLRYIGTTRGRTPTRGFTPQLKTGFMQRVQTRVRSLGSVFFLLLLTVILFSLSLGYQYRMVSTYEEMGVVDKDSWAFGQVVAVLFWAPVLLEAVKSYTSTEAMVLSKAGETNFFIDSRRNKTSGPVLTEPKSTPNGFGSTSYEPYRPLAHSPAPSPRLPGGDDATDNVNRHVGQAAGTGLRPLQNRHTLRMEEGAS